MKWFDYMKKYDLVLIIGTLEHFVKEEGRRLLSHLIINNKKMLISTPLVFQEQGKDLVINTKNTKVTLD